MNRVAATTRKLPESFPTERYTIRQLICQVIGGFHASEELQQPLDLFPRPFRFRIFGRPVE
nr:hypothetical protein RFYW14_02800 [Pseudorhizobium flavum]